MLFFFLQTSCTKGDNVTGSNGEENRKKEVFTKVYNTNLSYYSKTLGKLVTYSAILPKEYLTDDSKNFGVVFLFHGWGGSSNDWGPNEIYIQSTAESMVAKGQVRPLIYIIPDCENTYFCNKYDGKRPVMDMIVKELVPQIDKQFRTTAKAEERCVMGYSMGGFGALSTAMQHQDVFKTCVALSPSMNTDEQYVDLSQEGWNVQWGDNFGGSGTKGISRLTDYYLSQCPLHFMKDKPISSFNQVRYYIDCGDDEERLYQGSAELHNILRERGIYHEYRVRNGAHTTSYWRSSLDDMLQFIESSFNNKDFVPSGTLSFDSSQDHVVKINDNFEGVSLNIYKPKGAVVDNSYKFLYSSIGEGKSSLDDDKFVEALDSLMEKKKLVIVTFNPLSAKNASKDLDQIEQYVEKSLSVTVDKNSRFAFAYGKEAGIIYRQTVKDNATVSNLFSLDADWGNDVSASSSVSYYLFMGDDGTNYKSMAELFVKCRAAESNVQYRVYNGEDATISVQNGIHMMCSFLVQYLNNI